MTLGVAATHDKWAASLPRRGLVDFASPVSVPSAPADPIALADFVGCVDRCVRLLLGGSKTITTPFESALLQLRGWLYGKTQALDDGTPVDFALFDATILSIEERMPQSTTQTTANLLHASRRLAESVYAKA